MIEFNMGIKNAGLHADFKFVEKVVKNLPKRVLNKNATDHALFQLFLMNCLGIQF
jgi:hypothetical protein